MSYSVLRKQPHEAAVVACLNKKTARRICELFGRGDVIRKERSDGIAAVRRRARARSAQTAA